MCSVESKGVSPLELDSAFLSPVSPAQIPASSSFLDSHVPSLQENTLSLEFFAPALKRISLPSPLPYTVTLACLPTLNIVRLYKPHISEGADITLQEGL